MSKNKKQNGNSCDFYYGLEFVLAHSDDEIKDIIKKLEAKRNRRAMARQRRAASFKLLQRKLQENLGSGEGRQIEAEINRRFAKLQNLRMKG